MIYVTTTPINPKTGMAVMDFDKVTRKIYECNDMQEALIVESNLNAIENTGYTKIFEGYPKFKKQYNIINETRVTDKPMYALLEFMDLTDIDY
jgi:hypothetical protein